MNPVMSSTAALVHCDIQDLERATTIVHLNAAAATGSINDKTSGCDICGKVFSRHNLERHKRTHRGEKLFACLICARSFSQKSHLTVHERIHTGERPFKCTICGCAFSRKDYLVRHTRTQHSGKVYNINNQMVATPQAPPMKKPRSKKSRNSMNMNTSNNMIMGNSVYHQHQSTNQVTSAMSNPFNCDECWKEYTQSQQGHINMGKRGQSSVVGMHMGGGQVAILPYVCDICGKGFQTNTKLMTHRKTHTRPKVFNCDVCGKAFSRRDHLHVHKRIHTGERPFKCEVCGYAFTRVDHLERHKRPNKGARKLSCVPRLGGPSGTEGTSPSATGDEERGGNNPSVSTGGGAGGHHHGNGNATTITTLTNVPHHITVQTHPTNVLYANIPSQISVSYHPNVHQQIDVSNLQMYTNK